VDLTRQRLRPREEEQPVVAFGQLGGAAEVGRRFLQVAAQERDAATIESAYASRRGSPAVRARCSARASSSVAWA